MAHFHVLQLNQMLHGGDYNPEQWLSMPEILEKDIELMKKAKINCVSLGIFAWSYLEPQEGIYDFEWLEKIINRLYQNDIYTILATPSGAKPLWMSEKYPEIRRVSNQLRRDLSGSRHNHCYTSPIYREKVRQINMRLAKTFGKHPGVILWHISNEYGGECYCPLCQQAFRNWLQKKYGTIDSLNAAWWTSFWSHRYNNWEEIHAPVAHGEMGVHGLTLDWKRFVTDQTVDFMRHEIDAVKSQAPHLPVTANLMSFYDGLNYFKFKDALDIISWDNYPLWHSGDDIQIASETACAHDLMRSIQRAPFLLMESSPSMMNWTPVSKLKSPGMHMLSSMQAVAHGSNSVQYFQWRKSRGSFEKFHGAVVGHDGTSDTRVFEDVRQVGKRLSALSQILDTQPVSEVAIIYDWENRWALETAQGPRNAGMHYLETIKEHHQAFWKMGIATDLIDMESSLESYKLVVAPMLYLYRAGFSEKMRRFVENGGVLVATYWSGIVDENDLCFMGSIPGEGMAEVLGLSSEEIDALYDGQTNQMNCRFQSWLESSYKVYELCDLIHCKTAQVLAVYGSNFYKGRAALTVNEYGKGKAYYIAARPEKTFYLDFYKKLITDTQIKPALTDTILPHGVTATRRYGEKGDLIFVQNFNPSAVQLKLGTMMYDVEGEESCSVLDLKGYEVRILTSNQDVKLK